ncbi:uncharacterized protein EI90DRAFT_3033949 [Cantharellus anzutake]|uniref:uncharacterized protein n=1 Tax=Cantharellus anzutake TaxID=1750568 RepID=UPI001903A989|nr:uncharacterized protein EI90DRAFT_3033949 [Cantharellus anzutake]KAF8341425.1 hypothetical protein EI90DRAFT_3033949 [Cantharellus anzutake]
MPRRNRVPRFLRITSFAAFTLSMIHVAISFASLANHIESSAARSNYRVLELEMFPYSTVHDLIFLFSGCLHDLILIWKLFKTWNDSYLVSTPSAILWLAGASLAIAAMALPPDFDQTIHARSHDWRRLTIYSSIVNNALTSSLIVYKLLKLKREMTTSEPARTSAIQKIRIENIKFLDGAIFIVLLSTVVYLSFWILGSTIYIFVPDSVHWSRAVLSQITAMLPALFIIKYLFHED